MFSPLRAYFISFTELLNFMKFVGIYLVLGYICLNVKYDSVKLLKIYEKKIVKIGLNQV